MSSERDEFLAALDGIKGYGDKPVHPTYFPWLKFFVKVSNGRLCLSTKCEFVNWLQSIGIVYAETSVDWLPGRFFCFIRFPDIDTAGRAINRIHANKFKGGRVRVSFPRKHL